MEVRRGREGVREIMSQRKRERARAPPAKGGYYERFLLPGVQTVRKIEQRNVCVVCTYAYEVQKATREKERGVGGGALIDKQRMNVGP